MYNFCFQILMIGIYASGLCWAHPKLPGKPIVENSWNHSALEPRITNETLISGSNIKERIQRLGYTTGYGGLNPYPGTGISSYPIKIDIGGVVLGTLVGIGAILVIPKIVSIFHSGYLGGGQYARSENEQSSDYLTNILTKIDDFMGQNNIDSTTCVQRAVCSYVKTTETNMVTGLADEVDHLVHSLSENSFVKYVLDGTAIKDAVENGKNVDGQDCGIIYKGCEVDSNKLMKIFTKILPKNKN